MRRSGWNTFFTGRWWRAFQVQPQDAIRTVAINLRVDPFQGNKKRIEKLVKKYFKTIPERNHVVSMIQQRGEFYFDSGRTSRQFIRKLGKLITLDPRKNTPIRFSGRGRVWVEDERYYHAVEDMNFCTECKGVFYGPFCPKEMSHDTQSLSELNKKEVSKYAEKVSRAA